MELLPGDALRVSDPVFVAAGIATGRLAYVEHGHVGVLSSRLHLNQLLGTIDLEAKVVEARLAASRGDGEVHPRVFKHPLGVVSFDPRRLGREQTRVKRDARLQVFDMEVYVEPFHVGYFQHWQLVDEASRQASAPWQQFSVR